MSARLIGLVCLVRFAVASLYVTTVSTVPGYTAYSPNQGSVAGGNWLAFTGRFSDPNNNLLAADPYLFSITVGGNPCAFLIDSFTQTLVNCTVPPATLGVSTTVPIVLKYKGVAYPIPSPYNVYTYSRLNTPYILFVDPVEACPGDTIALAGMWTTNSFSLLNSISVNGISAQIISQPSLDWWGWLNVSAVVGNNVHFDEGVTANLYGNLGDSFTSWLGISFEYNTDPTVQLVPYNFRVLARIDSLSVHAGSLGGGTAITVTGAGFVTQQVRYEVYVKNIAGEVYSDSFISYNQFTVFTGPSTKASVEGPNVGNGGLVKEFWQSTLDFTQLIGVIPPFSRTVQANPEINLDDGYNTRTRLYGLFDPPFTATYTFYISSDDNAKVFLNPNSYSTTLGTPIINFSGWTDIREKFRFPSTISAAYNMYLPSYLEIWHYQGSGASHFEMGMIVSPVSSNNLAPQVYEIYVYQRQLVRESQIVTLSGVNPITGGPLVFTYGGSPLPAVAWDNTNKRWNCANIVNSFNSLNIGSFLCNQIATSSQNTLIYNITFNYPLLFTRSAISVDTTQIIPNTTTVSVAKSAGNYGLYGNFTMSLPNGHTSPPIPYGQNLRQLELNLNTYFPELLNQVKCQGVVNNDYFDLWISIPYTVFQQNNLVNGYILTINTDFIYGGYPEGAIPSSTNVVSVYNHYISPNDGNFYNVIPSDYLSTYEYGTQLQVNIHSDVTSYSSVAAICRGDCTFLYVKTSTPIITEFTYINGVLTITGQRLASPTSATFAWRPCAIVSASITSITCTVTSPLAGNYQPQVLFATGYASVQTTVTVAIPLVLDIGVPTVGTIAGGTSLTYTGSGFPVSLPSPITYTVFIGNSPCNILSTSATSFTCQTTAFTTNSLLVLTVGTRTANSTQFTYTATGGAIVSSVTPSFASTIVDSRVVIIGVGFSFNQSVLSVFFGPHQCYLVATSPTEIDCDINGGPQGFYPIIITTPTGIATFANGVNNLFELRLQITSIGITKSSIYGGSLLMIQGFGFSLNPEFMYIIIGDQNSVCLIQEVFDSTSLSCVIPPKGDKVLESSYPIMLFGRLEDFASCPNGCSFTWSLSVTPELDTYSPNTFTPGAIATFTGKNLGTDPTQIQLVVGGVYVTVTSVSDTSLTFKVPVIQANLLSVSLFINNKGYGLVNINNIPNQLIINSVGPLQISQGGANIVFTGSGMYSSMNVVFGNYTCTYLSLNLTAYTCVVPPSTNPLDQPLSINGVPINDNTGNQYILDFAYAISVTAAQSMFRNSIYQVQLTTNNLKGIPIVSSYITTGPYPCTNNGLPGGTAAFCIPTAPPGNYPVTLYINGIGAAATHSTVNINLSIITYLGDNSSYAGGMLITLLGSGLGSGVSVTVCTIPCQVTGADGITLYCIAPLLATTYSMYTYNIKTKPEPLSHFTPISSNTNAATNKLAYDGSTTTWWTDSHTNVYIGADVGAGFLFTLSSVKISAGQNCSVYYKDFAGTTFQISNDSVTWTTVYTWYVVNNFWNVFTVPVQQGVTFRYFRLYRASRPSTYAINEIVMTGILFFDYPQSDLSCPIVASYGTFTATSPRNIWYTANYTSVLDRLEPQYGTAAGGTVVGLFGHQFQNVPSLVTILIDGAQCNLINVTAESMFCVTTERMNCNEPGLSIFFAGRGYASTRGLTFTYADYWSSRTTWGGEVPPFAGESVDIPPCTTVILDVQTPILDLVLIEGTLIFKDFADVSLDATYVFVSNGTLQIGTEDTPYSGNAAITIHGTVFSPALPIYGNSFIAVRYGVIDLHGQPKTPSWTTLAYYASAGDYIIVVNSLVNWQPEDQIMVTTTAYDTTQSEVSTIANIFFDDVNLISAILIYDSLTYNHYIDEYSASGSPPSNSVSLNSEVAVLTRNIQIIGSNDDLAHLHGVHLMVHDPQCQELSIGRIENVEIYQGGQAYYKHRFPIYFNNLGWVTQSYIRNNAIHHSFNRGIVLASTNYLEVSGNVVYDVLGSAILLESGQEVYNTIQNNLVVSTHISWHLYNIDQEPAAFMISNPTNYLLNNVAAGSEGIGYWYNLPSFTINTCCYNYNPQYAELGSFDSNVAHSIALDGLWIFANYFPTIGFQPPIANYAICNWWQVPPGPLAAVFNNFVSWKTGRDGASAENVGYVVFQDFTVLEYTRAGIEITYADWTQLYVTTQVVNAVIIGNIYNSPLYEFTDPTSGAIGLITAQTDGLFINGATFYNIGPNSWSLGDESHSDFWGTHDTGARICKLQGINIQASATQLIHWGTPYRGIFDVLDDSITGQTSQEVFMAAYWVHLINDYCSLNTNYNAVYCVPGHKIRRVTFFGQVPWPIFFIMVAGVQRTTGENIPASYLCGDVPCYDPYWSRLSMEIPGIHHTIGDSWNIPFVAGFNYRVHWDKAVLDWTSINIEQDTFDGPEWVVIEMNFTDHRENFTAWRGISNTGQPNWLYRANDFNPLTTTSGTFKWHNDTWDRNFTIFLSGVQGTPVQCRNIYITALRCVGTSCSTAPVLPCIPANAAPVVGYWSDPTIWGNSIPVDGSTVVIQSNWHIYVDVDTPVMQLLQVDGILEFGQLTSASVHAKWIFIRGGSIISGNSTAPVLSNVTHQIVLHGIPNDTAFAFTKSIEGGNKVMVVTGNLQLYGYPKTPSTFLEQNTYTGQNFIFVDAVDWQVGDQIAIAASGFNPTEHEVFTITNVVGALSSYDQLRANIILPTVSFTGDSDWISGLNNYYTGNGNAVDATQNVVIPTQRLTKVYLDSNIKYYHSGSVQKFGATQTVDMRTEVVLLNRNVKITTDGNGWQSTVVVSDFVDTKVACGASITRHGSVYLDNVAFDTCGQFDTLLACIRFESSGTSGIASTVSRSVFNYAESPAVYMNSASKVTFSANTFFNTRWRTIIGLGISKVIFDSNIIIRVRERHYVAENVDYSTGFLLCPNSACNFTLTNNRVTGFDFLAYVTPAGNCYNEYVVHANNKARSGKRGFMYTNNNRFLCSSVNSTKVHFTSVEGVGFKSSSLLYKLNNMEVVENIVGLSMKTQRAEEETNAVHQLMNSVFVGKTIHSKCLTCTSSADCSQRRGYIIDLADTFEESVWLTTILWLPLYWTWADATVLGDQFVTNTFFANYNPQSVCLIRDFAITSSEFSPDYSLPNCMSKLTWYNVDINSRIYMYSPDPSWINPNQCADFACTGPNNVLVSDFDGSLIGYAGGGWVIPNNPLIAKQGSCTLQPIENVYYCLNNTHDGNTYMELIFESLDSDEFTRTFGPVNITTPAVSSFVNVAGTGFFSEVASYIDFTWNQYYANKLRRSRFNSIVWSGQYYNISSYGELPLTMKFRLQSPCGVGNIIVAIWYQDPMTVIIADHLNNTIAPVPVINGNVASIKFTDPVGTNRWFYDQNTIQFVLGGNSFYYVKKVDSIQINLYISMTLTDFYSLVGATAFIDRLATVLNIPSWTVRIVNIVPGPTTLTTQIISQNAGSSDLISGQNTAQRSELESILATINSLISQNALGDQLKLDIINAEAELRYVGGPATPVEGEDFGVGVDSDVNPNGANVGVAKNSQGEFLQVKDWIKVFIAVLILALMLVSGLLLYKAKSRKVSLKVFQEKSATMNDPKRNEMKSVEFESECMTPSLQKKGEVKDNEEFKYTDYGEERARVPANEWANMVVHIQKESDVDRINQENIAKEENKIKKRSNAREYEVVGQDE